MTSRGVLTKIWHNFKQSVTVIRAKDQFIGTDHYGNRYFERPGDSAKGIKESRRVEPRDSSKQFPEVPSEWLTWLQGRRRNPPSDEELEKNLHSSMKIQARVKDLELKHQNLQDDPTTLASSQRKKSRFPTYNEYEKHPGEIQEKEDFQK